MIFQEIINSIWPKREYNHKPTLSRHPLGGSICDACGAWWYRPYYTYGAGGSQESVSSIFAGGAGASSYQITLSAGSGAE